MDMPEFCVFKPFSARVGLFNLCAFSIISIPRIGVSLRHVDKVPRGKELEHTILSIYEFAVGEFPGRARNT